MVSDKPYKLIITASSGSLKYINKAYKYIKWFQEP